MQFSLKALTGLVATSSFALGAGLSAIAQETLMPSGAEQPAETQGAPNGTVNERTDAPLGEGEALPAAPEMVAPMEQPAGGPEVAPLPVESAPANPTFEQPMVQPSTSVPVSPSNLEVTVRKSTSFEMFNALLRVADTDGAISDKLATGSYTIFAPTDSAFAALPRETVKQLVQPENRELLKKIISYHILPGKVPASAVETGIATSIDGQPLYLEVTAEKVTVNGINVVQPDILASNGVIHAVEQMILPAELQAQLPQPSFSRLNLE